MVKHNNKLPNVHLRKHWQKWVKTFYNQPGKKVARRNARAAKAAQANPRPLDNIRPVVASCTNRYAGKARVGKGFSLEELRRAKISPAFARTIGISVDHRRQNRSEEGIRRNVDRLTAYKQRLVILPVNAKAPRKACQGVTWADVTEAVQTTQNTTKHVIALPTTVKRIKPTGKIPTDMNQFDAKGHLKLEWVNARHAGKRAIAAKEAENQ